MAPRAEACSAGVGFLGGNFLVSLLVLLVYLPMALRHVYTQSRWWTAVKTVALFFAYGQLLKLVLGMAMFWVIWSLT